MGHAALGIRVSLPRHGVSPFDPPAHDPDPGSDLGVHGCGWFPDGLTEQVIDRLYGDLLHGSDEPDGPSDEPDTARLFPFPARRPVAVSAGQPVIAGGEAA